MLSSKSAHFLIAQFCLSKTAQIVQHLSMFQQGRYLSPEPISTVPHVMPGALKLNEQHCPSQSPRLSQKESSTVEPCSRQTRSLVAEKNVMEWPA